MNVTLLREKISSKGSTLDKTAKAIGIDRATMYRKMKANGESFTIKQANDISEYLSLTPNEAKEIFF